MACHASPVCDGRQQIICQTPLASSTSKASLFRSSLRRGLPHESSQHKIPSNTRFSASPRPRTCLLYPVQRRRSVQTPSTRELLEASSNRRPNNPALLKRMMNPAHQMKTNCQSSLETHTLDHLRLLQSEQRPVYRGPTFHNTSLQIFNLLRNSQDPRSTKTTSYRRFPTGRLSR